MFLKVGGLKISEVVPLNIAKFLTAALFIEHFRWLLLPFTSNFQNYPLVAASASCQHLSKFLLRRPLSYFVHFNPSLQAT